MTPQDLREAMARRRWAAGALGAALDVNRCTVQKWLAGNAVISRRTELAVLHLCNREDVRDLAALRGRVALLERRLADIAKMARLP